MRSAQKTFNKIPVEKQNRILSEATREFADHGYHQASINRIVNRLGIAKGSLFTYFGNKEGLFKYLFSNAIARFKKPLKVIRDTEGTDIYERIQLSFLASAHFVKTHPNIYNIYLKMLFNESFPLRNEFLHEIRTTQAKFFRQLIEDGIQQGQLTLETDIELAVFTLHALMDRFLQGYALPSLDAGVEPPNLSIEEKAQHIAKFFRDGLGTVKI